MKKSKKKFSVGMIIFNLLSLIIVLFIIYILIRWNLENAKNQELQDSLISDANVTTDITTVNDTEVESTNVDFPSLVAKNKDIVRMD